MRGGQDGYVLDPANYTIEEVAQKARKFLFDDLFTKLDAKPKADMFFYVGGYSKGAEGPEHWLVKIDGAAQTSAAPTCLTACHQCGLSWGGQPEAVFRIIMGVGTNHKAALAGFFS